MLTQAQLDALFKRIAAGTDVGGAFAAATPELTEEQRNQYVNQYGSGGTNYKDWLDWYKANQTALNRDPNPTPWQPGGIFGPPATQPPGTGTGPGNGINDPQNPWLGAKTAGGAANPWVPTPFTPATTTATGGPTGAGGLTGTIGTPAAPTPKPVWKPAIISAGGTDTRPTTPATPAVVQTTNTPAVPTTPTIKPPTIAKPQRTGYTLRSVWQ